MNVINIDLIASAFAAWINFKKASADTTIKAIMQNKLAKLSLKKIKSKANKSSILGNDAIDLADTATANSLCCS